MQTIYRIGGVGTEILSAEDAGAKAANLSRMAAMGLPAPPAFVIPTAVCARIANGGRSQDEVLRRLLAEGIEYLEKNAARTFGDRRRPLLVSVRSGAARSMPGMLETVLDVGCTMDATLGLIRTTGNPRFAWDCRRRFLQGWLETVLRLDSKPVEALLANMTASEGAVSDRDLDGEALERLSLQLSDYVDGHGAEVPESAMDQLYGAARAVIASWNSEKAKTYRRLQGLEDLLGTAVTVQSMAFGNRSLDSGSGVAFSRDPSVGADRRVVDILFEAQGEDVVSGRRTPENGDALSARWPELADELDEALGRLEHEFRDVQDVEFTVDDGKLWLLQTRSAKRTPRAALRIAVDLVAEAVISPDEALLRLADLDVATLEETRFENPPKEDAHGVPAAPGVACGRVAFDSEEAVRLAGLADPVILVRPDTSTADVAGFAAASGILTASGGRTAHAALVARQLGKPCVVGCPTLSIDLKAREAKLGDIVIKEGDMLSLDGDEGRVFVGALTIERRSPDADLAVLASWRRQALGRGA